MSNKRSAVFDIAKFLAMCLVVQGHLLNICVDSPAFFINLFHMPVLFFISGFLAVFSLEKRGAGVLAKKKVTGLLLPYLCWSAVSLLANATMTFLSGEPSAGRLLAEAVEIFLYARSVWFLMELFVSFIIFLAIHVLLRRIDRSTWELPLQLVLWLLLSCFVPGEFLAFYKFKWLYPFFLAGYFLGERRESLSRFLSEGSGKKLAYFSLLFPLLALFCLREEPFWAYMRFTYTGVSDALWGLFYYGLSGLGIAFLLFVSSLLAPSRLGDLCAEIGNYSLDIYVIHMLLIRFVPMYVSFDNMGAWALHGGLAVIALLVILAIWLVSKYILRKVFLYRAAVGLGWQLGKGGTQ